MAKRAGDICVPLPSHLTNQITTCENSEQYLINFLQNLLPTSDCKSISEELRKSFIFNKLKGKCNKADKLKGKFLSTRKRSQLGLGKVGCKNGIKYSDVLPLNRLWLKYMQEMLGNKSLTDIPQNPTDPNWENINQQLAKADLHGAKISVVRSKCPSLIGVNGIILQDTKNVFRICSPDNIIRTIPKDVVVIDIFLESTVLEVFGKELSIRPTERTVKKLKAARVSEL